MQEMASFSALLHDLSHSNLPQLLAGPLEDASQLTFFRELNGLLHDALDDYGARLFERMMGWVGMAALTLLTLWISIQGYRILTGRSHASMMVLVTESMKAIVIVGVATGTALGGSTLFDFISHDLANLINRLVTGQAGDVYESIDRSLGYMQLGFSSIDAIQTAGNRHLQQVSDRNAGLIGLGMGLPAIVAGSALLVYKGTLAMIVGFAPLCVLCLLFEQSRQVFWNWLYYLLGTLFGLAVLSVMTSLAMDVICAVATSFWTGKLLGSNPEGVISLAMQQGGIGLVLTVLVVTLPQGAARFFKGLLAEFAPFSAFGQAGSRSAASSTHAGPSHTYAPERNHAPTPTHAHRVSAPARAQADEVRQAADARSFSERYPNALVSLDGHGAAGDALPEALRQQAQGNMPPPVDFTLNGLEYGSGQAQVLHQIDLENLRVAQGQVTFDAEGNDDADSRYYSRHMHWPGDRSGVTLGRGYDMGSRSRETVLRDLLSAGVELDAAEHFADGAGLTGVAARDFVQLHNEEYGEISRAVQRRLFEEIVYPRYVHDARDRYSAAAAQIPGMPSWDDLDFRVKDVAIDLTYQQGLIYRRQMPIILGNDRESLARYIETTPELSQYEGGRHRAAYLRQED